MRWLIGLFALLWATSAFALTPEQIQIILENPKTSQSQSGTVQSVAISDSLWTSTTDLTPVSQYINGWSADVTIKGLVPGGVTSDYTLTGLPSCSLSFTDSSPGYTSAAAATTVSRTICATSWLRQTYNNATLPTEAANSGNGKLAVTLSDFIYQADTLGAANSTAGWYSANGVSARTAGGINVPNSSTRTYPRPICAWVTPPGQRIGTSGSLTVEMFCGHAYAQGGVPVAAVKFTLSDGTHTVSHTISSLTASAIQFSTSCTATNGSAQLTSCGSTAGLQVGERMNVPGIPGQPKILSLTSTTITFGQTTTCTPTLLGNETISTTPGTGEALADGGFVGATITDANLTTSPATIVAPVGTGSTSGASVTLTVGAPASGQWSVGQFITGLNIPANDYISALGTSTGGAGTVTLHTTSSGTVSGNVTGSIIGANPGGGTVTTIHVSTSSAVGVASSGSCTINHIYQGSTGSVTATLGNPVPVYSATFTSGDISGASIAQGAVSVRAQAYPNVGNVVLDTQTGADGTQCDWFYPYVNSAVCNSSSAAWFATTGLNVSPNLHNLWAYNDADNSYSPLYCFIGASGTATTTAAACSTSSTAPAHTCTTTCAASIFALLASIKTYNGSASRTTTHGSDINGIVACFLAGTYTGFGGAISTSVTASKPSITMTSVADSSACPASGSANANLSGVTLGHSATAANLNPGTNTRINNVTINDTAAVIEGSDTSNHTSFLTDEFVFNNDSFVAGGTNILFQIGVDDVYNSLVDEHAHDGNVFSPLSTQTNTSKAFFNTIVGGSYTTHVANQWLYVSLGNDAWGIFPTLPNSNAVAVSSAQGTSTVIGFNRYMGNFISAVGGASGTTSTPLNNYLDVNNIFECLNGSGLAPCEQISADGNSVPASNLVRQYDVVVGSRTNYDYLEGVPLGSTVVASGGSLPATNYFTQIGYALNGNPTVQTSTDGPSASFAVGGTGSDSLSIVLPCDPNYVFYIYLDSSSPPAHYATVGGSDAKQLAGCQTVVATAVGGAATAPTVAGTTGHNEFKTGVFERFTIDTNFNMKTDTYNQSGATASGGRVGNWEARWKTGWIGNVYVTGTVINTGYGPTDGLGEIAAYLDTYNPANSNTDLSWVTYGSDRSFGAGNVSTPTSPALNIGEGDYCPANSTHVGSRVPAGFAAYPWDINGTTRKNDGTGYAGAFETGCL